MSNNPEAEGPFAKVPQASEEASSIVYIDGYCFRDLDPAFLRIYPDASPTRLSCTPSYYFRIKEKDVRDVIFWSAAEMTAARMLPSGGVPYASVGLESVVQFQLCRI